MNEFYDLKDLEKKVDYLNADISFCKNAMIINLGCSKPGTSIDALQDIDNRDVFKSGVL